MIIGTNNKKFQILVVDDEAKNVQLLGSLLKDKGYAVEFAISGTEALNWVNNKQFDLILLDIMMPVMNGFEVCEQLKPSKNSKDIPVIFITAKTEVEDIVKGFELGGVDYLTKPFNFPELLVRVKTHLRLKLSMEKFNKSKEMAEAADRAKSEFLANMSHEIQTPLNSIISLSELVTSRVSDKKLKTYIDTINITGKGLSTLFNDILDLSKIEAGKLELQYSPVNPKLLFTELKEVFELDISKKNLQFKIEVDPQLPPTLLLDELRLRQILFNLMGNAVKFTEDGFIRIAAKQINLDTRNNSIDFVISVEDSGIGITNEAKDIIFEAFTQFSPDRIKKFAGTGLGLTIAKRLLDMMNGEITLKSTSGLGSTFEITLIDVKISSEQVKKKEKDKIALADIYFEKGKVLVVDDLESNRILLTELLTDINLTVITAENGAKSLEQAQQQQPDLIFMDIVMPVMDGLEATKQLKENTQTKHIPVVALSASSKPSEFNQITEIGFDAFLPKPVNLYDLYAELANHFNSISKPS